MQAYVAVTDRDWYRFLRNRPDLDEINFWQPGGKRLFKALKPGEPFLFKLHYPENAIVGGGAFVRASILDSRFAWDAFGEKNGAPTYEEMRRRIQKYRKGAVSPYGQYNIGCVILVAPFFLDEQEWIETPENFRPQTVQGKTYGLDTQEGQALLQRIMERVPPTRGGRIAEATPPMEWTEAWVRQRLGQGSFRVLVTDTYQRTCAVTREKALPVLEAAHIRPVTRGGLHAVSNGLLLRSDVHTLFDQGYVTVTLNLQFRVSRRLKADFDNGEHYYQLDGSAIWVPRGSDDRPEPELLEWHADTVFRG